MDFAFSSEQDEFRTSLRRFLSDKSPLSQVRASSATELGYDAALWRQMSDQLGLPGLHLPEEYGGSGTGLLEPAVVLEETGRALTSSPYTAGCSPRWPSCASAASRCSRTCCRGSPSARRSPPWQ